jgi:hypothetical protein
VRCLGLVDLVLGVRRGRMCWRRLCRRLVVVEVSDVVVGDVGVCRCCVEVVDFWKIRGAMVEV